MVPAQMNSAVMSILIAWPLLDNEIQFHIPLSITHWSRTLFLAGWFTEKINPLHGQMYQLRESNSSWTSDHLGTSGDSRSHIVEGADYILQSLCAFLSHKHKQNNTKQNKIHHYAYILSQGSSAQNITQMRIVLSEINARLIDLASKHDNWMLLLATNNHFLTSHLSKQRQ